jgi:chromosome segregation ATPase
MQIPKEYLEEKNYEGSRLVEIIDPEILKLKQAIKDIQEKEANPILNEAEPLLKVIDPANTKIGELINKIKEISTKIRPLTIEFNEASKNFPEDITEFPPELQAIKDKIDPLLSEVKELESQVKEVKKGKENEQNLYNEAIKKVEKLDARASLIKEKMQVLVNKLIVPQLGEFEKALHLIEKDGKVFVEIIDEIEEKVKAIRSLASKK